MRRGIARLLLRTQETGRNPTRVTARSLRRTQKDRTPLPSDRPIRQRGTTRTSGSRTPCIRTRGTEAPIRRTSRVTRLARALLRRSTSRVRNRSHVQLRSRVRPRRGRMLHDTKAPRLLLSVRRANHAGRPLPSKTTRRTLRSRTRNIILAGDGNVALMSVFSGQRQGGAGHSSFLIFL